MGRKRKKLIAVDDKLPPCRVCDGPAAGFHYGVNTCDACKGFFHRSLTAYVNYKCQYDQNCKTEFWSKQFCHWCRYKKCLKMGMSKAAIKTGRYSTHKKTKDKLEAKKHRSWNSNAYSTEQSVGDDTIHNRAETPISISDSLDADISCDKNQLDIPIHKKHSDIHSDDSPLDIHREERHFDFHSEKKVSDIQHCFGIRADFHPENDRLKIHPVASGSNNHPVNHHLNIHPVNNRLDIHPVDNHFDIHHIDNRMDIHPLSTHLDFNPDHHIDNRMDVHQLSTHLDFKPDKGHVDVVQDYPGSGFYLDDHNADFGNRNVINYNSDEFSRRNLFMNTPASGAITSLPCSPDEGVYTSYRVPQDLSLPSTLKQCEPAVDCKEFYHAFDDSPPEKVRVQEFWSSEESTTLSPPRTLHGTPSITELPPESRTRSQSPVSNLVTSEMSTLFGGCSISQENDFDLERLYQDKDSFIVNLRDAFNKHIKPRFMHGTPEEIEQMQREHLEECNIKKNMYGHLGEIPDKIYDEIFKETGIDIDNRIQVWNTYIECVEDMIQGMVEFAKVIPGFKGLCMSEKINLIKYSRQEIVYFASSKFANMELGVFPSFMKTNKWKCFSELKNTACEYLVEDFMKLFTKIQELEVTDDERILMCAIILMNPDRNSKTQSPAVNQIHSHLIECLLYQMSLRFENPLKPFTDIVSCFTSFKVIEWKFKSGGNYTVKQAAKYIDMKDKPLFTEMVSNIQ